MVLILIVPIQRIRYIRRKGRRCLGARFQQDFVKIHSKCQRKHCCYGHQPKQLFLRLFRLPGVRRRLHWGLLFRHRFRLHLDRLGEQSLFQSLHGLGTILGLHRQSLFQCLPGLRREPVQRREIPGNGVLFQPLHRAGNQRSGEGVVNGGGHGVHIRPGAGAAPLNVLLQRAESAFRHLHGRSPGIETQILGRTQIQNFYASVGQQHQVVRAQIPVNQAKGVHLLHGGNHRPENLLRSLPVHRPIPEEPGFQGLALHEFHDNIGRTVFLEQVENPHHPGNTIGLDHLPGFLQEHLHSVLPGVKGLLTGIPGQIPGAGTPAHLPGRIVLLDGDFALQGDIPADIGNAETALAQHPACHVLSGQNGLRRQGVLHVLVLGRVIAAVRTGIALKIFHTAETFG